MIKSDLSKYEQLRFTHSTCPICNELITEDNTFILLKTRFGRSITYTFMHTECIRKLHRKELEDG